MMKGIFKKYLPEFVYGAIDGSVTTFAIVSGVVGASLSSGVILILGIASLFADAFSMGVSNYFSQSSDNDLQDHEHKNAKKTALITFIAFVLVGAIPLIPYVFDYVLELNSNKTFIWSTVFTLIAFYFIGWMKGNFTKGSKAKSGFEVLLIGAVASFIASFIGYLLSQIV